MVIFKCEKQEDLLRAIKEQDNWNKREKSKWFQQKVYQVYY